MANVKIQDILNNLKQVTISPSSMDILREFERVIDENGLYAFQNWKTLELVEGPIISAYRIKCTFSSPLSRMPDPAGGERLIPYGTKISYKKEWLVYPVHIKSPEDMRSDMKKPKLARTKVWLVTIDMPKYLIKDISKGSEEILDSEIDMEDINSAYEEDLDTQQGINKEVEGESNGF